MAVLYGFEDFNFDVLCIMFHDLNVNFDSRKVQPEMLGHGYVNRCKLLIADLVACEDLSFEEKTQKDEMISSLIWFISKILHREMEALELLNRLAENE